jgi:glycosyltransferase involved in cell wall biosynthesis
MDTAGKLNIGIFVETHEPGVGLFHVIDPMVRHLLPFANVSVFTSTFKDRQSTLDLQYPVYRHHIYRLPWVNIEMPFHFLDFKFYQSIKHAKLDIVHIHSAHTLGQMGIQYAKRQQIPIIGTRHGLTNLSAWNPATSTTYTVKAIEEIRQSFLMCDLMLTHHQTAEGSVESDELMKKPVILPLGTETPPSAKDAWATELRQKHAIKSDEKVMLSVNHGHVSSHLTWIADSLFKLRLKGFKFRWIIIDFHPDDKDLKERIQKNGLNPYVTFVQTMDGSPEYAAYLKLSDIILHASLTDPFYSILVDAASQKKTVITIEESPISRHLSDGINGYLSKSTPTAYAEKIIEILKYPKTMQKIGDKAYQDFYRTWDEIDRLVHEAYQTAVEHNKQTV